MERSGDWIDQARGDLQHAQNDLQKGSSSMRKPSSSSVRVFSPRYTQEEVIESLRARMPQLLEHLPARWVVLFGSYAKGNYTAFSDIDLLVVYAGKPRDDAFALVKRTFGLVGLESQVLAEEEFQQVLPVWTKMLEHSITIWGQNLLTEQ